MPAIPGSVRLTGFVAPSDSADTYAVTDDTYHRGGFRPVADAAARDAITEGRRKVGMLVYCIAEDKYYQCTVATTPPTWVEAAFGGDTREGVCELVTVNRDVLPADNRLFLESDAAGSSVTPISMTIDQAAFSLVDDEGWQVTFKVGMNDDGDPVPVFAACSTSEMSIDDATFIQTLYSGQLGDYLTVRYAYAAARRGRFLVVGGKGTWTDDLGGVHVFGSSGAINVDTTMYVDGSAGDDGNDGLTWGTAKQTFGFLIAGATDAIPHEINAVLTINFRNDILARDANGHLYLSNFYGTGRIEFVGTLTSEETLTASTYENDPAVRHGRVWVNDATKAWTPGEWRRHFVKIGADPVYYPIFDNTATKLYLPVGANLAGTPACTIYSAPELLSELVTDPGVKYEFGVYPSIFLAVNNCPFSVRISNLWVDEASTFTDTPFFSNSGPVDITNVAGLSFYASRNNRVWYYGCYFNLSNYGYIFGEYNTDYFAACAFDSLDDTGWGYNSYSHAYGVLSNCVFNRQLFGVYLWGFGTALLQRDIVFRNCDVGILLGNGSIEFVDPFGPSPQTRFDTGNTAILGVGSITRMDGVAAVSWSLGAEVLFGSNDEGTFTDLAAGTLKGRAGLGIIYSNLDFEIFPPNEYDNSVSGLTAKNYQAAIDEVAASTGGAPVTPEFSVTSPRLIVDADHNGEFLAAASVIGGFIYQIDHAVVPGTIVRIGSLGFTLKIRCQADTIIMGTGPFTLGVVGIGFGQPGYYIDLIYIGEITEGVFGWGIIGGSGVVTELDGAGDFTTNQFAFNGYVPDGVAGNALTLDANLQIIDAGYSIDDLRAAYVTSLDETAIDLVDDTDFTAVEAVLYVTEGMGYTIVVTPTTATGNLTVILYQDAARLEPVYTMVIDLSDATTYRSAEAFGFELETAGTLYGTAFVSGVGASETFDIAITALGLQPTAPPTPLPSPYGDGIEDDGLGKPRIAFPSDGGFVFATGKLELKPDLTADVYPTLSAAGVAIANAVTTTTDEDIAAKKRFTAVGMDYLAADGPPVAGTYLTGHEVLDLSGVKWRCISGGTPGTWVLVDFVADASADYETALLTPGDSEVVELITTGDVGYFQQVQVWGFVADPAEYSSEFRARIYQTSSILGREMVWQGVGTARQSYLTVLLPAATTDATVNDEDVFDTDEACVVFEDNNRYELARISSRGTGTISFDEVLVDPSSWAVNTLVCSVAQFDMVPFRNTDGTPANRGRAFLQIRNDSAVNDVTFFIRVLPMSTGIIGEGLS